MGGRSGAGSGGTGGPSIGLWMVAGANVTRDAMTTITADAGGGPGYRGSGPLGLAMGGAYGVSAPT